jgi:hypothetical protein
MWWVTSTMGDPACSQQGTGDACARPNAHVYVAQCATQHDNPGVCSLLVSLSSLNPLLLCHTCSWAPCVTPPSLSLSMRGVSGVIPWRVRRCMTASLGGARMKRCQMQSQGGLRLLGAMPQVPCKRAEGSHMCVVVCMCLAPGTHQDVTRSQHVHMFPTPHHSMHPTLAGAVVAEDAPASKATRLGPTPAAMMAGLAAPPPAGPPQEADLQTGGGPEGGGSDVGQRGCAVVWPHMLVTGSLHDERVPVWGPAK